MIWIQQKSFHRPSVRLESFQPGEGEASWSVGRVSSLMSICSSPMMVPGGLDRLGKTFNEDAFQRGLIV